MGTACMPPPAILGRSDPSAIAAASERPIKINHPIGLSQGSGNAGFPRAISWPQAPAASRLSYRTWDLPQRDLPWRSPVVGDPLPEQVHAQVVDG